MKEKKISIIISVYNEENAIDKFFEEFDKIKNQFKWDYEIIFVNDGSRDASPAILDRLAMDSKKVKVIHFSRNYGHEAAMIAGIDYSSGDGIVCMDADLQHPVECIPQILDTFNQGYEVISMVRTANKSAGFVKNLTSGLFYKILNKISDQARFEENASDFFAISNNVARVLKNNYREKVRFLRGYVQSVGFKSTTIEYSAADRAGGESHYNIKRLLKFSISTIVCFSDFPLKLGIYAGLLSALAGIIVLIYSLCTITGSPSGYTTLVTLICFMFAVLFIVIGVIGQYIAVMFSELKDKPIYIIEKKINFDEKNKE